MKILGINTSHDSTVAWVEDNKLIHLYEEGRVRRDKWWSPLEENGPPIEQCGYTAIPIKGLHKPDQVAFTSFDRRGVGVEFSSTVHNDRVLQKDIIDFISAKQMSWERYLEMEKEFGSTIVKRIQLKSGTDEAINEAVMNNSHIEGNPKVSFEPEHHYFHAVCADHFSPYDESLIITWDGGGWRSQFDLYPGHQEIECIFHSKDGVIKPLFKRMCNTRELDEICQYYFRGYAEDCLYCLEPDVQVIDDVEYEFVALPSNGMNFSNMSVSLGCDDYGRSAGKVMGMASYSSNPQIPNVFSRHTMAQKLEIDALEHSKTVIQKAIDLVPDCKNIVLSGGYSLNCTNNYKYLQAFPDYQFFVDPVPHDGGTAVGAALDLWRKENVND